MIDMISPDARWRFAGPLLQIHRGRPPMFEAGPGGMARSQGGGLEVDAYDNDQAVYLIARDEESGDPLGSVRLLPTTGPHLLEGVFASLCPDGPPRVETIWEISRLVTSPGGERSGTGAHHVDRMLALALVEFGLLNRIGHYVVVTESRHVPALLSIGWRATPLSLPTPCHGQLLEVLQIEVEAATGVRLHRELGIGASVFGGAEAARTAA